MHHLFVCLCVSELCKSQLNTYTHRCIGVALSFLFSSPLPLCYECHWRKSCSLAARFFSCKTSQHGGRQWWQRMLQRLQWQRKEKGGRVLPCTRIRLDGHERKKRKEEKKGKRTTATKNCWASKQTNTLPKGGLRFFVCLFVCTFSSALCWRCEHGTIKQWSSKLFFFFLLLNTTEVREPLAASHCVFRPRYGVLLFTTHTIIFQGNHVWFPFLPCFLFLFDLLSTPSLQFTSGLLGESRTHSTQITPSFFWF